MKRCSIWNCGGSPRAWSWPWPAMTLAQLAGACLYVAALRLYEMPVRPSGMPHVTDPTRRWARLAFALMLVAAAADFGLAAAEAASLAAGRPAAPALTDLSAARH